MGWAQFGPPNSWPKTAARETHITTVFSYENCEQPPVIYCNNKTAPDDWLIFLDFFGLFEAISWSILDGTLAETIGMLKLLQVGFGYFKFLIEIPLCIGSLPTAIGLCQELMSILCQCLRKDVCNLEIRHHMWNRECMIIISFPNRVTVNLNTFCLLMEDRVCCNKNSTSIIHMKRSRLSFKKR